MAQIWVNLEELAGLCRCSTREAKDQIRSRPWPTRRCGDGQTRVKLPDDLAAAFIRATADAFVAQAARGLRSSSEPRLRIIKADLPSETTYSIGQ